jgi:hypothetical protein
MGSLKKGKKVKPIGWFFIGISFLINLGNGCLTIINSSDNNKQLLELKSKTDTIRFAIIDNAAKAMDEQRKTIEKERENTFIQMQNEVGENLRKTLLDFKKQRIIALIDTPLFVMTKLEDTYIKKYNSITANRYLIYYLTQSSEVINVVNYHVDKINAMGYPNDRRKTEIKLFLESVELAKDYFYPIYFRVYNINSSSEYESIKWADSIPPQINRDLLNDYILTDYINSPFYERYNKIK